MRCDSSVYWWDGEYEGDCNREVDHEGAHTDGLSHWDDDGHEVDPPDDPPAAQRRERSEPPNRTPGES